MRLGQGSARPNGKSSSLLAQETVVGPVHPFHAKLNEVLAAAGFATLVEEPCARFYKMGGRPKISPGVCFRMVLIGYFEGIDSQRGSARRCAAYN